MVRFVRLDADDILSETGPISKSSSHNDSENSWLSVGSSIDLESQNQCNPPPPAPPEKDLSTFSTTEISEDLEAQRQKPSAPFPDKQPRRHWLKLSPRMISDAIIGISDGMTVPFALTAGLASLGDTRVVVLGGLAELVAGALSMGLGGFIGAKSEA